MAKNNSTYPAPHNGATSMNKNKTATPAPEFVEKEPIVDGRKAMAFSRINYILLIIGMVVVIIGFLLMVSKPSTAEAYNPDIFSPLHIKVAPVVCLAGFLFMIVAIIYKPKQKQEEE